MSGLRRIGAPLAAAGLLAIAACGSGNDDTTVVPDNGDQQGSQPDGSALTGTYWTLQNLQVNDSSTDVSGDANAYLIIENGEIGGNTGCNVFTGDAEIDEEAGTVVIGDLISTARACTDQLGEMDNAVFTVLRDEVSVEISGDTLTVTNGNGDELRFTASEETPEDIEELDELEEDGEGGE